jgi:RecB family endonuclease NucS
LKDPYILDFLNLPQEHYESDLEAAILQEIEKFMLELGTGFSFVARQKRITIDNEHFYIDLLMYNRKINRFVVIELKSGRFKPEYKGQMELYLGWLRRYECLEGEELPIGIILCTEKSKHQIELLDLSSSGIHVAEYWTELPPKEVFEKKIQQIVTHIKEKAYVIKNKNK